MSFRDIFLRYLSTRIKAKRFPCDGAKKQTAKHGGWWYRSHDDQLSPSTASCRGLLSPDLRPYPSHLAHSMNIHFPNNNNQHEALYHFDFDRLGNEWCQSGKVVVSHSYYHPTICLQSSFTNFTMPPSIIMFYRLLPHILYSTALILECAPIAMAAFILKLTQNWLIMMRLRTLAIPRSLIIHMLSLTVLIGAVRKFELRFCSGHFI